MKSSIKIFFPVVIIFLLLIYSCSTPNEKMPLTTKSEEAARELKRANMQNPYNLFILAKVYKEMDSTDLAKDYLNKAATFYSLPNLQYAFVRNKASQMLNEL